MSDFAQHVTVASLRRGSGPADEVHAADPERRRQLARQVVDAAEGLSRWQHRRTQAALVELVGPIRVAMAENLPASTPGQSTHQTLHLKQHQGLLQDERERPGLLERASQTESS